MAVIQQHQGIVICYYRRIPCFLTMKLTLESDPRKALTWSPFFLQESTTNLWDDTPCDWCLPVGCAGSQLPWRVHMDIWATYSDLIRRSYVMSKGLIWMFPKIVVPQNGWLMMETPIKMDDLWVPLFLETPIYVQWKCEGLIELTLWTHGNLVSPKCEPVPGEEKKYAPW